MPSPRSAWASATTASAARVSGSSVVICEPMWTCAPTGCSPRRAAISRNSAGASSIGTPNLLDLRPVEMWGWLLASMSGLTRSATRASVPCAMARWSMRSSSPGDSTLIASSPSATARSISARALADAGEDDLIGTEAAAHRDVDLAERIGVAVAAERVQQPHHRERRIGLQRVVNGVRIAVERLVERRVGGADHRGVVDVARRADGLRNLREPGGDASGVIEGVGDATPSILSFRVRD